MSLITRLIDARRGPFKKLVKEALALYGVEVPPRTVIGRNLRVMHRGFGIVIHPFTTIGNDVTIYHGVTIGRADPWIPGKQSPSRHVVVEDDVILCAGAKVISGEAGVVIGRGTVVGAGAVLTRSTGEFEIWAGVPARRVGLRPADSVRPTMAE